MDNKNCNPIKIYEARINRVLRFINENLEKELSLGMLSREAFFSPYHFHRIFLSIVGETPGDFVKRLRLEKAANLLIIRPEYSITEIALSCGFSSSSTFARAFRDYFNYSASDWRNGGALAYSEKIRNSKNCKTDSKTGKEYFQTEEYFSSVDNYLSINNQSRKIMNVEIKKMPKLHLAYVSHNQGYNSKVGAAFEKLCRWAGPRGLIKKDSIFLGISLDNPDITPPDKCRYYASMTIPEGVEATGGIGILDLPELNCAVYRYEGYQDGIEQAYNDVYKNWLPESGYQPDDYPSYEIYLRDPNEEPKGFFVLEVCLPVKPL
ncbi:MAG: AraC family transcriptional regulator [Bacteroidota bacterium]|nr:AraC family transcriptional regulator [Bacteroidota bacterium]